MNLFLCALPNTFLRQNNLKLPAVTENLSFLALRWHYVRPLFFQGFVTEFWGTRPQPPPLLADAHEKEQV